MKRTKSTRGLNQIPNISSCEASSCGDCSSTNCSFSSIHTSFSTSLSSIACARTALFREVGEIKQKLPSTIRRRMGDCKHNVFNDVIESTDSEKNFGSSSVDKCSSMGCRGSHDRQEKEESRDTTIKVKENEPNSGDKREMKSMKSLNIAINKRVEPVEDYTLCSLLLYVLVIIFRLDEVFRLLLKVLGIASTKMPSITNMDMFKQILHKITLAHEMTARLLLVSQTELQILSSQSEVILSQQEQSTRSNSNKERNNFERSFIEDFKQLADECFSNAVLLLSPASIVFVESEDIDSDWGHFTDFVDNQSPYYLESLNESYLLSATITTSLVHANA